MRKRFYMPGVWYSWEHLQRWIGFLRARHAEGRLTHRQLRNKIRQAVRNCEEQRRRHEGRLPADGEDPRGQQHYQEIIDRELARKL
jgi:hypothetical protein